MGMEKGLSFVEPEFVVCVGTSKTCGEAEPGLFGNTAPLCFSVRLHSLLTNGLSSGTFVAKDQPSYRETLWTTTRDKRQHKNVKALRVKSPESIFPPSFPQLFSTRWQPSSPNCGKLTPANTWNASAYTLISMYAFYSDHFGMWENGIMTVKFCYHEKGNELF
ncbi:Uncharacterized protein HZ326_9798 [Fusarium oxysporum f. sp. albedinis]|nr:Uncharacterized protein HZ326_9798 [Fusarium oxysporum f. sp. albedinis]